MAKKQIKEVKERIVVAFYSNEFDKIKEEINKEVTGKNIREFFGLPSTHRERISIELREELQDLSKDEKRALLEEIRRKKNE